MKSLISFILDTKNNRPGEARVRMRVKWGENMVQRFIPYTVNPEKWNKGARRCTPNTTHGKHKVSASVINRELQLYEDSAEKALQGNPSKNEFIDIFNGLIGKEEKKSSQNFSDVIGLFIEQSSIENSWSVRTIKYFTSLKNHLKSYNKDLGMDLTESDLQGFILYMQTKESVFKKDKQADKGMSNKTSKKYISMIRWFLKWASAKGYYKGNLHQTFKPKLKSSDDGVIVFLTWDELMKMYKYDFKNDCYNKVRDVFCFCCFTSLRYSDVAKLKKTDVYENHISINTQKTHDQLMIDLNNYSREILHRHKGLIGELALPVISNQKMNVYLKKMGKILEFDNPVTKVHFVGNKRYEEIKPKYDLLATHCGRRTFVVNALFLGIPAAVIMKWTGHKDYEAMKPYISIVDSLKRSEMEKFNKKSDV